MRKRFVRGIGIFVVMGGMILWGTGEALADGMVIHPPTRQVTESGQKAVIWWDGKKETMIVSTTFRGNAEDFAWIIPVPNRPEVTQGKDQLFTALNQLTAPVIRDRYAAPMLGAGQLNYDSSTYKSPVQVLETKRIDIYETAVLEASDGRALRMWLEKEGYPYPDDRDYLLQHYVNKNWYFVAAKVMPEAQGYASSYMSEGHATPLSLTFDTKEIVYPLKISGPGRKTGGDRVAAYSFEQGVEGWYGLMLTPTPSFVNENSRGSVYSPPKLSLDSDIAKHGNNSMLMKIPDNSAGGQAQVSNSGLVAGRTYTFSAYVQGDGQKVSIEVASSPDTQESKTITASSSWQQVVVKFTPSNGYSTFRLKAKGTGSVWWDAVQIESGSTVTEFTVEKLPGSTSGSTVVSNSNVPIVLYVFADKKKTAVGFQTEYAGKTSAKVIENLATNDNGEAWIKTNGKGKYLTKLTANMSPVQMGTDDLILRDAANNDPVGGGSGSGYGWVKMSVVAGVPLLLEIAGIGYYLYRRKKK